MKKVGLRGLTVSVTTHLCCSCSAAKTHSSFIKEGAEGHQLPDLWCNKAVSEACVRGLSCWAQKSRGRERSTEVLRTLPAGCQTLGELRGVRLCPFLLLPCLARHISCHSPPSLLPFSSQKTFIQTMSGKEEEQVKKSRQRNGNSCWDFHFWVPSSSQ